MGARADTNKPPSAPRAAQRAVERGRDAREQRADLRYHAVHLANKKRRRDGGRERSLDLGIKIYEIFEEIPIFIVFMRD